MGQAKPRAIDKCYLCGQVLAGPTNVDHVPPKLFFPEELRKGLNLSPSLWCATTTMRLSLLPSSWSMDTTSSCGRVPGK
jgi:hypothetical protein